MSNQRNQPEHGRELTLKETSTASLLSRLKELNSSPAFPTSEYLVALAEIESTEQELEERQAWESKVSRW